VPEREVRFTEQFFDRLDWLLPEERSSMGEPSVTDFLLMELPTIRDLLSSRFEDVTVATSDPDVRVCVVTGVLVKAVAVFASIDQRDRVEVFWLVIDRYPEVP
jgi:hypothetical protein